MNIKKTGIIIKPDSPEILKPLKTLIASLEAEGVEVLLDINSSEMLGISGITDEALMAKSDTVFVLGGDGTLLYAAGLAYQKQTPLVGFHMGRLGFITPFYQEEIAEVVKRLFKGALKIQDRMRLSCRVMRAGECIGKYSVLNEVALLKSSLSRIVDFELYIDKMFIKNYRADGFLVSSPTGSTGYALSNGGPLVDPSVELLLLLPICSHSIDNRDLIIGADKVVELCIEKDQTDAYIMCDGRMACCLEQEDIVEITISQNKTKLYYDPERTFFDHLKNKFNWGRF